MKNITLETLKNQLKDVLSTKGINKWHFIGGNLNGIEIKIKVFSGKTEVDLQIFSIGNKGGGIGFNYGSRAKTLKAIIEKIESSILDSCTKNDLDQIITAGGDIYGE